MLTGRDLLSYALNNMKGDKLTNLLNIAEEIGLIEGCSITTRAISLINPCDQYNFLEEIILNAEDSDKKLVEFLNSNRIKLPLLYGWTHKCLMDNEVQSCEKDEWYNDKHYCYRVMHNDAMEVIKKYNRLFK